MTQKKLLLISGFFPPYSPMGAVRPPSLAAYWRRLGYDVRVIALRNPGVESTLKLPLPEDSVLHLPFSEPGQRVDRLTKKLRAMLGGEGGAGRGAKNGATVRSALRQRDRLRSLRQIYQQLFMFPDRYRSWVNPAVKAGLELATTWKPDLIYSSCPPHSGHIVAQKLAAHLDIPWVAELRDLWANNPYNDVHPMIDPFQRMVANGVLRRATACVTLTQTAGEEVRTTLKRPTIVSYNGFGATEFEGLQSIAPADPNRLTIIHAGIIYPGRRDPTTLFQALAILGRKRNRVKVSFYHDSLEAVARKAVQLGVQDCVEISAPRPRSEILELERAVDVLLLCRWANVADDGIIPGKLFEYIGARRPILAIGSTTGEAADIIRRNHFGTVSNSPIEIARQLSAWIDIKTSNGCRLPDLPEGPTASFVRERQFEKVTELVDGILNGSDVKEPERSHVWDERELNRG